MPARVVPVRQAPPRVGSGRTSVTLTSPAGRAVMVPVFGLTLGYNTLTVSTNLLLEDGMSFLLEDGTSFLLESA